MTFCLLQTGKFDEWTLVYSWTQISLGCEAVGITIRQWCQGAETEEDNVARLLLKLRSQLGYFVFSFVGVRFFGRAAAHPSHTFAAACGWWKDAANGTHSYVILTLLEGEGAVKWLSLWGPDNCWSCVQPSCLRLFMNWNMHYLIHVTAWLPSGSDGQVTICTTQISLGRRVKSVEAAWAVWKSSL